MTQEFVDPSNSELFDGTPFDSARMAAQQALDFCEHLMRAVDATKVQGLNAHMERNLMDGRPADALTYPAQPEHEVIEQVQEDLELIQKRLILIQKAVGFDPSA